MKTPRPERRWAGQMYLPKLVVEGPTPLALMEVLRAKEWIRRWAEEDGARITVWRLLPDPWGYLVRAEGREN